MLYGAAAESPLYKKPNYSNPFVSQCKSPIQSQCFNITDEFYTFKTLLFKNEIINT